MSDETPAERPKRHLCVGCQEASGVERISGLGYVCESCSEVPDIVRETEVERTEEATQQALAFAAGCVFVAPPAALVPPGFPGCSLCEGMADCPKCGYKEETPMGLFDTVEAKPSEAPKPKSRLIIVVCHEITTVLYACGAIEYEHNDGGVPGFGHGHVRRLPDGVYVAEGEPSFYNARGFEDAHDEWTLDTYEPTLRPITSDEWKRYCDHGAIHEAVWDDEWNAPEEA